MNKPKVFCRKCGREVRLRNDGRYPKHNLPQPYRWPRATPCPASDEWPAAIRFGAWIGDGSAYSASDIEAMLDAAREREIENGIEQA